MAYTWEPRWKPVTIRYSGIEIHTCMDRITGMIACPICTDAVNTCLSGDDDKNPGKKETIFFFTEKDLLLHIKAHYTRRHERRDILREIQNRIPQ